MIKLTFTVDDINTVMHVYDRIEIQKSDTEAGTYATVSGLGPILLSYGSSTYILEDMSGIATDWYVSRYYSSTTSYYSEWSKPVLGEIGDLFYNPLYPEQIAYNAEQQLIIDRIRRLIGDPIRLRRSYGEDAIASVHADSQTFELSYNGWPASVIMGGINYNDLSNPSVSDYRYLRFDEYIGDICNFSVTYSGCATEIEKKIPTGIDIWYYTFRNSDMQLMNAYDNCPPPPPLTTATANTESYLLQTSIDILRQELWLDATEDGAIVKDAETSYDPSKGLEIRKKLLDDLEKRLDKLIKILMLSKITGVLID
jgi:hypothetical protein